MLRIRNVRKRSAGPFHGARSMFDKVRARVGEAVSSQIRFGVTCVRFMVCQHDSPLPMQQVGDIVDASCLHGPMKPRS